MRPLPPCKNCMSKKDKTTKTQQTDRGRPPKIDDEQVRQRLRLARSYGMTEARTAAFAGISQSTWREWRRLAKEGLELVGPGGAREGKSIPKKYQPYVSLIESLEQAEAEGEYTLASGVNKMAILGGEVRKREVVELYLVDSDGQLQLAKQIVKQKVETLPPDFRAASFVLARRYGWTEGAELEDEEDDEDIKATKTFEEHSSQRVQQATQALLLFGEINKNKQDKQ